MYEGLLALHILVAVVWVGGALSLQVLAWRADRSNDPTRVAAIAAESEWIGFRVFMPASILLLLAGIGLVLDGGWGFGQLWILFALAVYAFSFLSGALFLGPEAGRIKKLVDAHGFEHAEVRDRIRRIFFVSRIEAVLLVLVVLDMAVKPGL